MVPIQVSERAPLPQNPNLGIYAEVKAGVESVEECVVLRTEVEEPLLPVVV